MDTSAKHLLVEFYGCDRAVLDDREGIGQLMRRGAEAAGARVVAEVFHPYAPHGITGVVVIEESHFSVHTWPEAGYAAVDFYTCGDCQPERALGVLREGLGADRIEVMTVQRGLGEPRGSIRVASHHVETEPARALPAALRKES